MQLYIYMCVGHAHTQICVLYLYIYNYIGHLISTYDVVHILIQSYTLHQRHSKAMMEQDGRFCDVGWSLGLQYLAAGPKWITTLNESGLNMKRHKDTHAGSSCWD